MTEIPPLPGWCRGEDRRFGRLRQRSPGTAWAGSGRSSQRVGDPRVGRADRAAGPGHSGSSPADRSLPFGPVGAKHQFGHSSLPIGQRRPFAVTVCSLTRNTGAAQEIRVADRNSLTAEKNSVDPGVANRIRALVPHRPVAAFRRHGLFVNAKHRCGSGNSCGRIETR